MFTTQIAEATIDKALVDGAPFSEVARSWKALKEANQEISRMVGNMLNYCRDDQPGYSAVDLHALIAAVLDGLGAVAAHKNVALIREFDASISTVELDRSAIHDAMLNLVTNAIDAIPPGRGGHVWVRTYRIPEQNNLRIEVADDGTGVPEDVRDRMFNLFFSTKGRDGSGIGLASTRKIVERHGGTVSYESTPGRGTCFRIFLPLMPAPGVGRPERP